MKITMIGTGYVGLVSGAVFADWGNDVVCLDIDKQKVDDIMNGKMPIYEEGLSEMVERVIESKKFKATTNYKEAVEHAELIFICVGTPSNQSGAADLSYVFKAAESIGEHMPEDSYKVVIGKSTVPVGTNLKIKSAINKGAGSKKLDFDVASNPEFLREGTAIYDAENSDRVVIGSDSKKALDFVSKLYENLDAPIVKTDIASAELIKYAANAFLSTKITFINEISQICERVGADVKEVAVGLGLDSRVGSKFLNPTGIGFGGSCFPKDVEALYRTSSENLYDFKLLRGVLEANERQRIYFVNHIIDKYGANLSGMTFGVLGAAFKNDTDDVRKSPALEVVRILRGHGAKFRIYDPAALENAEKELGPDNIEYVDSAESVFENADALLILTEWKEFASLDYPTLVKKMKSKDFFDARYLVDPKEMAAIGVDYFAIGRHR